MLCGDQPLGGASRGDVMKMHLADSYISFHAIPQGKWGVRETVVSLRGHQLSTILCRQSILKYLGYLYSQARSQYVVRRFRGTRNESRWFHGVKKTGWIHYFFCSFKIQDLKVFWDPLTIPCLIDDYNVVDFCISDVELLFEFFLMTWHLDDYPLLKFQVKCYSLYVMLQCVDC